MNHSFAKIQSNPIIDTSAFRMKETNKILDSTLEDSLDRESNELIEIDTKPQTAERNHRKNYFESDEMFV